MERADSLKAVAMLCFRVLTLLLAASLHGYAQLSSTFYDTSCPTVATIVAQVVQQAVQQEPRMAASLLRLHFHDCFVNGCDGSILLDDTSTTLGEKTAIPNNNSVRGFDVVDNIKSAVEAVCNATVSCADILALAANVSVSAVGGPSWTVLLGRRDGTTVSSTAPNTALPNPKTSIAVVISKFTNVGLTEQDAAVLSGAHTIGRARCTTFSDRLYNFSGSGSPDPTLNPIYRTSLQTTCPPGGNPDALTSLDLTTPDTFDNSYYVNLQNQEGLLQSDQELYSTPGSGTIAFVNTYSSSQSSFFSAFGTSMVSMGNISPLTGSQGEIRLNCRKVNG